MNCNRTPNFNIKDRNCILETIMKVDQIQKEAMIQEECETCESSLMVKLFNTKPVTFYLCCGEPFTAEVPGPQPSTTTYFRIQEIKGDCVLLRILNREGNNWTCTNHTVVLKISCICGLQCFPPICCKECHHGSKPRI